MKLEELKEQEEKEKKEKMEEEGVEEEEEEEVEAEEKEEIQEQEEESEEEVKKEKKKKSKKSKKSQEIEEEEEEEEVEEEEGEGEEKKKKKKSKKAKKEKEQEEPEIVFTKPQHVPLTDEQKDTKTFIIQSGVKSGKSISMIASQLNDFYEHIKKFDPKSIQKDQDENTHGLFSVVLCNSKEQCEKSAELTEKLLMKYSKKEKSKLPNRKEFIDISQEEKALNSKIEVYNLCAIENQDTFSVMPNKHYVLVATPGKFLNFATTMKVEQKYYVNFGIDDLDYMISFGYKTDLDNLAFHFQEQLKEVLFVITLSSEILEDIQEIKDKLALNGRVLDVHFEEEIAQEEEEERRSKELADRDYRIVSQYYHIGDQVSKYIILYIMYKLNFLNGKTLVVCPNVDTVYKVHLYLSRIGIKGIQILNEEDPKNLRYYVLSMFNTGLVSSMITTKSVFTDLQKKVFYQKKRKILNFKNLNNIINLDIADVKELYNEQYKFFRGSEGSIINLIEKRDDQIEALTGLITKQKQNHEQINMKEFPLKKNEVEAFRYRIADVVTAISNKQVKNSRMVDFKKKMLKSKDMEKYFRENEPERKLLVEEIQKLSLQIHQYGVKSNEDIPDYLVPEMIREQREKTENAGEKKFTKIQVTSTNEDFKESLKRRMEANNLTLADVKKKRVLDKISNDKYVYVNNAKEDVEGEEVDPSKLKIISGRKLWKQRHGFKTKKRNRRLERKGIHNA